MTPCVPDVHEEDFGDLEESEEGQSLIRKSTREGSPDNGLRVDDHLLIMGPKVDVQVTLTMRSILAIREGKKRTNPPLGKGLGRAPDNGSQHEYTSDRGRVRAGVRAVLGVEEEPGGGAPLGEGAKLGEGGKPEERAELREWVQGGERLVGEGAVPVPLVVPQMRLKSKDRKRNPTLILMILMMMSMHSLLLLHIVQLEFTLSDQSYGVT